MLRRALQSVAAQTFRDFEVIVVDDGSDTAGDVCAEFVDEFPLLAMNLEKNSGYQSAPRNMGVIYSSGAYIAHLDDDNEWDPEHLEALVGEIRKARVDGVYSRWRYDGDGPMSGMEFPYHQMNKASALGLTQTPMANFIDTSSMLYSKAAMAVRLGRDAWNTEIRRFGDWDLAARSVQMGMKWKGVDRVTYTYYWHGENLQLVRPADERAVAVSK
jgi:glycosyltransferase involved in cell wall biosynthesis